MTRRRSGRFGATLLLMAGVVACGRDDLPPDYDPLYGRQPSRFQLTVALDVAPRASPSVGWTCSLPIAGVLGSSAVFGPEVGLEAVFSHKGSTATTSVIDANGEASVNITQEGVFELSLTTADKKLYGRLPIELAASSTRIRGYVAQDSSDFDQDGDRRESVMVVETLPDGNGDYLSDTGTKEIWGFTTMGAMGYRHIGRQTSERLVLDAFLQIASSHPFADRDGDWVPDDEDADSDGDGFVDTEEGPALPCPGFSHNGLQTPGSKHETMSCSVCHADNDVPLACHDCHALSGRAFMNNPDPFPTLHFERDCEQCHKADQAWQAAPGPNGEDHRIYPLTGKHLVASCFGCHVTGNVWVPSRCVDCHKKDEPQPHFSEKCDTCHTTDSWVPTKGGALGRRSPDVRALAPNGIGL